MCPGFGPACLSAFLSGYFRYFEPTVWLGPKTPWSFKEIREALGTPPPAARAYRETAFDLLERMVTRLSKNYILSLPDFGDGMDILSFLRHNLNLLTDLYDEPKEIQQTLAAVSRFETGIHERTARLLLPANGGACATVMRYLSAEPHTMTYCDFSAMIGPDHFDEFVAPMVRGHCDRFPHRVIYHLDGSGQLLDGGKRISIGAPADLDRLEGFFQKFPESEFTLSIKARDQAEAARIARRFSP